jgi:tetratricopeptide (TPR) repeat protein
VKPIPRPPIWLPGLLHLAHGVIAGSAGYMLAYAATVYLVAEPGSTRGTMALIAVIALAIFEGAFLVYWIARRRRIKRLWREAAACLRRDDYEGAQIRLIELSSFMEYRASPQPVLFALGAALEGLGEEREALIMFRRCGDFPPALRAIGVLQLERGLHDSAADALRRLVAKHPYDSSAVVALALALVRGGHHSAAEKVLKRALEKRPKSEMLRVNLARVQRGEEPAFELDAGPTTKPK